MKQKINHKILIILLFFCTNLHALTLEETINHSSQHNNLIQQQNLIISSYKAQKVSNFSEVFLPSAYLSYNKQDNNNNKAIEKAFNVSYNLSELYKGSIGYKSGSEFLNHSILDANIIKNSIIISIIDLYLNIIEINKNIEVYNQSLNLKQKMLKQVNEKVKTGSTIPSSAYLIEAEVEEIKSLINLENKKLETEQSRFYSTTKLKAKHLISPKNPIFEHNKLENFLQDVETKNINIQSIKNKKTSSKYNVKYETSKFLPDFSLAYQKYSNKNVTPLNVKEDGSKIVLSAKFYLYKPGLISNVRQKAYEYRASQFELFNEIENKLNEARELWFLHQYYKDQLKSKTKIVKIRKLIVKERMQNYNFGMSEITEILDEENNLRNAELDLIKIKSKMVLNIYKMKTLQGERLY